jgi:hypothetical protein
MTTRTRIALSGAVVCGSLLLLTAIVEVLITPVIADALVEKIAVAKTEGVDEWHIIANDTLANSRNVFACSYVPLSLAVVVFVSFAIRHERRVDGVGPKNWAP